MGLLEVEEDFGLQVFPRFMMKGALAVQKRKLAHLLFRSGLLFNVTGSGKQQGK